MTREEWLVMRDALAQAIQLNATLPPVRRVERIAEDVFGPCPPEPAPPPHHSVHGRVIVTQSLQPGLLCTGWTAGDVTPDEADRVAAALTEHARYAREHGAS